MTENNEKYQPAAEVPMPDMTDMDEVRKAIIAGEILNRKY